MYKKITILALLFSYFIINYANTPIPKLEELKPVYKNFNYEYYYIESGINSNGFFSFYTDYIKNNQNAHIFLYLNTKKNKFIKNNFDITPFNNKNIILNIKNTFKYAEKDSIISRGFTVLSMSFINDLFSLTLNMNNRIDYSNTFYFYNYLTYKCDLYDKDFTYSLIFNKIDIDNFYNNSIVIVCNKDLFTIGIEFFHLLYPYIKINKFSNNVLFELNANINRMPYMLNYSVFSKQWDCFNMNDNLYYSINALFKYKLIKISINNDYLLDSIYNYVDIDDYTFNANIGFEKSYKKIYTYAGAKFLKNHIYTGFIYKSIVSFNINNMYFLFINEFFYKKPYSSIIISFNKNNPRIILGIKNIFEQSNPILFYYSENRTYFLNIAISNGSAFN